MRKFVKPLIAVLAGMAMSLGLQAVGVEPLYAKLAGLAVVAVVITVFWRRSAGI
ncbi:hypothetical protein GCM10011515_11090 [Tsuneonella deserti]|uniref:Uncharacterized protein n=1 Tax=Tsuneonella deserti TaxID=2035528 RepID=A0ABQ1S7W8_9SPHN|nr:hypothetical protein [Tsuneonella deserti]GGD93112.1 hypothetical protein GCM10011515_11090 [Tsuneonella deserti]